MRYYVVDAFAGAVFKGNPAGICLPEKELDAETMQSIAAENNLSETAFAVRDGDHYNLRWFTPKREIDLCGHATLGSAYVISRFVDGDAREIRFETKSGTLSVRMEGELFEMDFPSRKPRKTEVAPEMERAVGAPVLEAHVFADSLLLLLEDEERVGSAAPDFDLIGQLAGHAVMVTARGGGSDFVSRFFAPNMGVPEDPVTGSAHTILIPFWAERLGKSRMTAKQLSERGGALLCEDRGERVRISGNAALYLRGEIYI